MESIIKWQDGPITSKPMWKRYLAILKDCINTPHLVEIFVNSDLKLVESKARCCVDETRIVKWAEIPEVPDQLILPVVVKRTEITWYSSRTPPKTTGFYHVLIGGLGHSVIERKQYMKSANTWNDIGRDLYVLAWTDNVGD